MHEQHLDVGRALDHKLVEAILETEPCLLVGAVADVGDEGASLEPPTDAAVDTARLA